MDLSFAVDYKVDGLKWAFALFAKVYATILNLDYKVDGLKWTRTIDLTLIRRAL